MEVLILEQAMRGERDVVVTMLGSDEMQYRALAKGAREMHSKLRAGLLPLTIADAELIAGRSGWIARSCAPLLDCTAVRNDPATLAAGRVLAAVLREVSEVEKGGIGRFSRSTQLLRDLNTAVLSGESRALLRRRAAAVWVAALELAGYLPEFRHCVACQDVETRGLHPEQGGVVCRTHSDGETFHMAAEDLDRLRERHVPHHPDAVRTFIRFLGHFSATRLPATAGETRWATSELLR